MLQWVLGATSGVTFAHLRNGRNEPSLSAMTRLLMLLTSYSGSWYQLSGQVAYPAGPSGGCLPVRLCDLRSASMNGVVIIRLQHVMVRLGVHCVTRCHMVLTSDRSLAMSLSCPASLLRMLAITFSDWRRSSSGVQEDSSMHT